MTQEKRIESRNGALALIEKLRGFNTPDRTIERDRHVSVAIHEAADMIESLVSESVPKLPTTGSRLPVHEYYGVLTHGPVEEHGVWVRASDYRKLWKLASIHFSPAQIASGER